ncbi:hypothetical protein [uncultured Cohaesibacter sp.]|uniref:hypothetical protein n=1 Tax=uncultured Cohaesibacter sp. TaxID=1002546 RepID=UPI0029C89AB6|nr:hypothetical protein [uncultured Cohaesibacter sp.]
MRKAFFVAAAVRLSAVACLFLAALAVVVFGPSLAQAAEAQTYQIDTGPLISAMLPYFEDLLMAVVTAATVWLSRKAHQYFGVQLDSKHRDTLNQVIQSRLNQLLAMSASRAPTFYVRSAVLANVANYAIEKAPDAVRHFNLDEDTIRAMVLGRLGNQINKLTGDDDDTTQSAAAAVPDGFASAPVDLSSEVARRAATAQAGS